MKNWDVQYLYIELLQCISVWKESTKTGIIKACSKLRFLDSWTYCRPPRKLSLQCHLCRQTPGARCLPLQICADSQRKLTGNPSTSDCWFQTLSLPLVGKTPDQVLRRCHWGQWLSGVHLSVPVCLHSSAWWHLVETTELVQRQEQSIDSRSINSTEWMNCIYFGHRIHINAQAYILKTIRLVGSTDSWS